MMLKSVLVVFLGLLLLTNCTPVYIPNTRNIPDVEKPGELKFTGMVSTSGLEVNGNLMVFKNVGLMANFSYIDNANEDGRSHYHMFAEAGLGYHIVRDKLNFAIYAGHGIGEASAEDRIISDYIFASGDFQRTFLQPSLAINTGVFVPSFAFRLTRVHFYNYWEETSTFARTETALFFEPAAQFGFRFDPVEANLQLGVAFPFSGEYLDFEYRSFHIAAGVAYRFNY